MKLMKLYDNSYNNKAVCSVLNGKQYGLLLVDSTSKGTT